MGAGFMTLALDWVWFVIMCGMLLFIVLTLVFIIITLGCFRFGLVRGLDRCRCAGFSFSFLVALLCGVV